MKKKTQVIKEQPQREKSPDISLLKQKTNKPKKSVASITPSSSPKNIIKKKINKNPNNYNMNSIDNNQAGLKTSVNKQKLEANKTMIESKKENKKDNNNNSDNEQRSKSAIKKLIKHKNKDKNKNKKEDNIQLQKKNKDNKDIKDIKDNNNDKFNKTGDSFYKPKNNQVKKSTNLNINNNMDIKRRKSFDLPLEKNRKKRKMELTITNNKDISPLKTDRSNENDTIRFAINRNKKQVMNKTPDVGRIRKRKNSTDNENLKRKYHKNKNTDNKSINKTNNGQNENSKKEEIIKNNKNLKYKNRNKKYNSNYTECLYLALNSGFFNPNKKLKIILGSKELYMNFFNKKIIKELIDHYNKVGNEEDVIKNNANNNYDIRAINEPFKPNERCINALNFIDKEEEKKLINEVQHPYIIELFKVVLILLNEYKNNIDNKNIFEFFFVDILQKYKVKNIKKLMIKNFVNVSLIINDEQFELIQKSLSIKPDLFSPSTILRYNRAVAYFTFFIKELFSYLNLKTEKGEYYYKIRATLPKNKYQDKINNLKLLL